MANPAGSFIWYELMSPDPDGAKAFYDDVVGWTISAQSASPTQDYRMIGRSDGGNAGGVMKLTGDMARHGASPVWLGYLYTPDVDAAVAAAEADGGKLQVPATDMPGVGRIAMITDPQGAPFYVMNPTPPPGMEDATSDVFSVTEPQHIRWNELVTSAPDSAIAFYTKHFGWAQEGEMDMGPMGKYRFIQHGGVAIGAVMPTMPDSPASQWRFYIGVDDIDRAMAAIGGSGGKVVSGPHEIPGGEFSLHGIDPQGATFGLVGPRSN
jgi:uncharacterized protein